MALILQKPGTTYLKLKRLSEGSYVVEPHRTKSKAFGG